MKIYNKKERNKQEINNKKQMKSWSSNGPATFQAHVLIQYQTIA